MTSRVCIAITILLLPLLGWSQTLPASDSANQDTAANVVTDSSVADSTVPNMAAGSGYTFTTTTLYTQPDPSEKTYIAATSADASAAALLTLDGRKQAVFWNGSKGEIYQEILAVWVSPKGEHCGYYASKGKDYYVVIDGKEFGKYADLADSITFSPDDNHYLFWALRQREFSQSVQVVVDGKKKDYDMLLRTDPELFSPDGSRVAYFARNGKKFIPVVDGEQQGPYEYTGLGPIWSPDSKYLAYIGSRKDTVCVVINGQEQKGYTSVTSLEFSPDGAEYAYGAALNYDWYMYKGESQYGPYMGVWNPTYSPDGAHFSFVARRDSSIFIVQDGVELPGYVDVMWPVYSPDSRHLAYVAVLTRDTVHATQRAVLDGEEGPVYNFVYPDALTFSSNGEHFGYIGEIDTLRVVAVIDGNVGKEYQTIGILRFVGDDGDYIYSAKVDDSNWCIVRNGVEETFEDVWIPVVSDDGRHVASVVVKGGLKYLWIDGQLSDGYRGVSPAALAFDDNNVIRFFGRSDEGVVVQVTATPAM